MTVNDPAVLAALRQMLQGMLPDLVRASVAEVLPSAKVGADVGDVLSQVYPPLGSFPEEVNFLMPRDLVLSFTLAAGATGTLPLNISEPSMIYALSFAARDTTGTGTAAVPENLSYQASSGSERFNSDPALINSIFGTGAQPRLMGGRGWNWNRNATIVVTIVNLHPVNPVRVDIVYQALLMRELGGGRRGY